MIKEEEYEHLKKYFYKDGEWNIKILKSFSCERNGRGMMPVIEMQQWVEKYLRKAA